MDSDGLSKIALRIKHRQSPRYKILEETSTPQLEKELSRIKFPVALRPVRYYGDKAFQKGFTLIELLVVVAIIGLLSSVVLASLSTARAKARDARRIADLRQLEVALDLNYSKHGAYTIPENMCSDTSYGGYGGCGSAGGTGDWDANSDLRDLVTDGFMSELPRDPINNSTYKYTYEPWNAGQGGYTKAGQAYDLCALLEGGGSFCIRKR